jgi:hypothetical protein
VLPSPVPLPLRIYALLNPRPNYAENAEGALRAIWHSMCDGVPGVRSDLTPPPIRGTAALAHRAFTDHGLGDMLGFIDRPAPTPQDRAALTLDTALAHALRFQPSQAGALQREALAACRLFRVAGGFAPRSDRPLWLLALVAPGNLMVNTSLDFITAHLDVQLDLLFVVPGEGLPPSVPEHDVAFFAVSESDPATLERLRPLFHRWPRPALDDPAAVARLSRDTAARGLAGRPGLCSPPARRIPRDSLAAEQALFHGPSLIRPIGSHAGQNLRKVESPADLAAYLRGATAEASS